MISMKIVNTREMSTNKWPLMAGILCTGALALSGCRSDVITRYHSHAFMKRSIHTSTTVMRLERCSTSHVRGGHLGIIACLDQLQNGPETRYVIIAPLAKGRIGSRYLGDYLVNQGAVMDLGSVDELVRELKIIQSSWVSSVDASSGVFWEFSVAPSHTERVIGDSTVEYAPTLRIYGSALKDGHGVSVTLSEKSYWFQYEMTKEEELLCFIESLESAIVTARGLTQ